MAAALREGNFGAASSINVGLTQKTWKANKLWLKGTKYLISMAQQLLKKKAAAPPPAPEPAPAPAQAEPAAPAQAPEPDVDAVQSLRDEEGHLVDDEDEEVGRIAGSSGELGAPESELLLCHRLRLIHGGEGDLQERAQRRTPTRCGGDARPSGDGHGAQPEAAKHPIHGCE